MGQKGEEMSEQSVLAKREVLWIVSVYAVFSGLWILLSDQAAGWLFRSPNALVHVAMFKGWVFVVITSLLLYNMLSKFSKRNADSLDATVRALRLLESLSESSEDAIFAKDREGRYLLFNRSASRVTGKEPSEVIGKDDRAVFPPEVAERVNQAAQRVMEENRPITEEVLIPTTSGERVFLATRNPLHDADGNVIGVCGVSRDITNRKRREDALKEKAALHEQLNALAVNVPGAILSFRLNPDGSASVPFATAAVEDVYGFSPDALGSGLASWGDYVHPDDRSRIQEGLAESARQMSSWHDEFRFLHPSKGERWLESWGVPRLDATGDILWHGFVMDITDRKKSEQALKESERRFHDIVAASADWTWEVDAQARYTYASASVEELLGYKPEEIIGKTPFDLMPPEEAERVKAEFASIAETRAPFRDLDNIAVHKDGSLRHLWTNGMPILSSGGELLGYRGMDRDVTDHKDAQKELRSLSEDLTATLRAIPDLLFEMDDEGRYLKVGATAENLLAAPVAQLLGRTVAEALPPEAARICMEALAGAARTGSDYGRVIELPLSDGLHHFELSVARKEGGTGGRNRFVTLSRDVTDRRAAEEELKERYAELERFNRSAVGRELAMVELKRQINALSKELGREPPYPLAFLAEREASP